MWLGDLWVSSRPLQGFHKVKTILLIMPKCYVSFLLSFSQDDTLVFSRGYSHMTLQQTECRNREEVPGTSTKPNIKETNKKINKTILFTKLCFVKQLLFIKLCATGDTAPWGLQTCGFQLRATILSSIYNTWSLVVSCW